jgi:hypothetical protein
VPELIDEPEMVTTSDGEQPLPTEPDVIMPPTVDDDASLNWGMVVGVLGVVLVGIVLLAGKLVGKRP